MKIFSNPQEIQNFIKKLKLNGRAISLVPTMGALHEGHASLIRRARKESDVVVVSIFVNPSQFGPNEDLKKYPRPFKKDVLLCKKENVDIVFSPKPSGMYPEKYLTYITVEKISDIMCGRFRPGHFKGVATIVAKLFNIIQPDKAYFGLKDYQQSVIIKKMVNDLNFPVKIIACPTVREKSGLALSSRNIYLSDEGLERAISISRSLKMARNLVENKKNVSAETVISKIKKTIAPNVDKIDYIEIRDAETLEEIKVIDSHINKIVIAIAVFVGKTRLIDNIVVSK
ncbi:MAG: pantoate--beta-alanine ligase [Elusimicrobia bacterium]|nr:pantoate--beta-alanine ligase [Elusimicrobiota bacterium]